MRLQLMCANGNVNVQTRGMSLRARAPATDVRKQLHPNYIPTTSQLHPNLTSQLHPNYKKTRFGYVPVKEREQFNFFLYNQQLQLARILLVGM